MSNQAPIARDDAVSTAQNRSVTFNPLANDSDPEGNRFGVSEINGRAVAAGDTVTLGSGASVRLNADGTFSYDPGAGSTALGTGQSATDSFSYRLLQPAISALGSSGVVELSSLNGVNGFAINGTRVRTQ